MTEQVFHLSPVGGEKEINRVIFDENIHYIQMIFPLGEGLPEHLSNSNVYMTVLKGTLSIGLNDEAVHRYEAGNLLKIPKGTKMNVGNKDAAILELLVVKAPAPL